MNPAIDPEMVTRPQASPPRAPVPTLPDGTERSRRGPQLAALIAQRALYVGFVMLVVFFAVKSPGLFFTMGNFREVALSSSILLIVAVPQALLVIMGYVDLSVGSMVGLSGVTAGLLINNGVNFGLAILVALAVGVVGGLLNGLLVSNINLSPIIVTLGTLQLFRGIAQLLAENPPTAFGNGMAFLGRGAVFFLPVPVWIALLVLGLGFAFLSGAPGGRHTYAIGVNKEAAFLSGIATKRLPLILFAVTAAAAALGGVLYAARLDAAPSGTLGVGFELSVLTAVLLGGVAFSGGRGTMAGVLVGVLFLGVLQNGMLLLNVSFFWQEIATGSALIIAAALDQLAIRPRLSLKIRRE
jgi:ribose transport system permease protein